jgi:hypothetical protein
MDPASSRVHHAIVSALLDTGAAPSTDDLVGALKVSRAEVVASLHRLEAEHGIVLDPASKEPWIIHPFSLSPTATFVEKGELGWWAPCMWCAFGVCALAGGAAQIHARIGGEAEEIKVDVTDGHPASNIELLVHFAIPPRDAWNNVNAYCATVLPFRDEAGIDRWSARHRLPRGEGVPIARVAALGRVWYGRHAEPDWRKWSLREAADLFARVGLVGPFWDLGEPRDGAF